MESKWLRMVGLPSLRVQPLVVGERSVTLQFPPLVCLSWCESEWSETEHRLVLDSQKVQYLTRQLHVPKLLTEGSKAAPTCSVVWCYICLVSSRGSKLPRKCNVLLLPSKLQCMYFIGSTLL